MKARDLAIVKRLPEHLPALIEKSLGPLGAHELASFAYEPVRGRTIMVASTTHRGFVHVRVELEPMPGSVSATMVPWKDARVTASHEVSAGGQDRWRVRFFHADGPPIEIVAAADDRETPEGWHQFLEAILDHSND